MSIATQRGDSGDTSLAGGVRVRKSSPHIEACGAVDELNTQIGFARAICQDEPISGLLKEIQRELFIVGGELVTPATARMKGKGKGPARVTDAMVERLTAEVHRIESIEGVLSDWSLPGEDPAASALDVARAVCRRAERDAVRLAESGAEVQAPMLAYLNRLSDLLWLFGRLLEHQAGLDASLRTEDRRGPNWSRAW